MRPRRVARALRLMAGDVADLDGHAPIVMNGADSTRSDTAAGQRPGEFGVLLAGLFATTPTTVVEEFPPATHRAKLRTSLGVRITRTPARPPSGRSNGSTRSSSSPGEFSSATPFITAGALLSGSTS